MARQNLGTKPVRASDVALLSDVTSRIGTMSFGSWVVYQGADLSNATTTQVDTDLMVSNLPIGLYVIDVYGWDSSAATGSGPRFSIGSSTSGAVGTVYGSLEQNTSATAISTGNLNTANSAGGFNPGTANTVFPFRVHSYFQVLNASAKIGIRFASSSTTSMTLKAYSYAVINAIGTQSQAAGAAQRILTKRDITGAYTLVSADAQDMVMNSTSSSALTITLPANGVIPIESAIPWRQTGAGQITFAPASGMTLLSRGALTKSAGQYAGGVVTQISSTQWLLEGDIA